MNVVPSATMAAPAVRRPLAAALAVLLAGAGCASSPSPLACPSGEAGPRAAKVFYATDRRAGPTPADAALGFGGQRTDPPGLHMGWERVALGPGHRLGQLDDAVAITSAHERTETPGAAAAASALQRSDADIAAFVETRLRPAIRATPPPRACAPRQVLVFIHGYNTPFDEAVRKTAQLAGDLDLVDCAGRARGVAVAYSWPSQGTLLSYLADEENAEWTQQRLVPFLRALARVCREERAELNLVAHSMGARALVRSLADLANAGGPTPPREPLAAQVVLLAPDIGKGLFDQYVQRFLPLVGHLTIYVSAADRALGLSSLLHGGHRRLGLIESTVFAALELTGLAGEDHRELGRQPAGATADARVDMVDVTGGLAAQFGHSYEGPGFIRDLRALVLRGTPAGAGARRELEPREVRPGLFRSLNGQQLRYFRLPAS